MAYSKNRRLADIISDTSGNISVQGLTVPTQSNSDNDTSAASTAFVHAHVNALIDSAPGTLNTLNEIAAALNDDPAFTTTVNNAIATKLPLAGGTMTGNISHAGDFTIDVGGDLLLDVDGENIKFLDGGVERGQIDLGSGNLTIRSSSSNMDTIFRGNDGGTEIESMRIDYSEGGRVGIGTNSPDVKLDVRGEISVGYDATYGLRFYNQGRSNWSSIGNFATDNTADLNFKSGGGTVMTMTHAKKVGIGTTSPGRELHVKSSGQGVAAFESTGAGLIIQGNSSTTSLLEVVGYKQTDSSYHDMNIRASSSINQLFLKKDDNSGHAHVGVFTNSPGVGSENINTLNVAGALMTLGTNNSSARHYLYEQRYAGSNNLTMGYIANGSTHTHGFVSSQNNLGLVLGVGTKDNIICGSDRSVQMSGYVGFGNYSATGSVDNTVTLGARIRSMGGRGGQPNVLGWDHLDRSNSSYDHNSTISSSFSSSYGVNFAALDTSGNNRWYLGEGPNGGLTWLWRGVSANASNSGGQGGYDCGSIRIDSNYTYMLVNYVKRMSSTATGTYYFGTQNIYDHNGNSLSNPYMTIASTSALPLGVWCADIHFIVPWQYTGNASLENQGLWRMDTGARLQRWSGQFSGVELYRSYPSSTQTHDIGFRVYLYYATANDGTTLHFGQPAIYKCDGTEPTAGELRGGDKTLAYSVTGA